MFGVDQLKTSVPQVISKWTGCADHSAEAIVLADGHMAGVHLTHARKVRPRGLHHSLTSQEPIAGSHLMAPYTPVSATRIAPKPKPRQKSAP